MELVFWRAEEWEIGHTKAVAAEPCSFQARAVSRPRKKTQHSASKTSEKHSLVVRRVLRRVAPSTRGSWHRYELSDRTLLGTKGHRYYVTLVLLGRTQHSPHESFRPPVPPPRGSSAALGQRVGQVPLLLVPSEECHRIDGQAPRT